MHIILGILLFGAILALIFGPSICTKRVLRRNGQERSDFPGTGGELARHLLDQLNLSAVQVEETEEGRE